MSVADSEAWIIYQIVGDKIIVMANALRVDEEEITFLDDDDVVAVFYKLNIKGYARKSALLEESADDKR